MNTKEASEILHDFYFNAPKGEQALRVHLFGIKYANELSQLGIREILTGSDVPVSYHAELNKGRKIGLFLAKNPSFL